jgi:hypothetical protein
MTYGDLLLTAPGRRVSRTPVRSPCTMVLPMTVRAVIAVLALLSFGIPATGSPGQQPVTQASSVTTGAGDHVVLEVTLDDKSDPAAASVAALVIRIDGREAQHLLATPGAGRAMFDALLGPLAAGTHRITLERSSLWTWPEGVRVSKISTRVVQANTAEAQLLARTPTLGIRADTIGIASDLPLILYVEDDRRDGRGWIRFSVIMSHEDGGTPAPALMARWGRTTDIELIYEVEVDGPRIVRDRFQGPDHEIRSFAGAREGDHPDLLVATLNNMFIDRGRSLASVRPVPRRVNLEGRTRESVMDEHPWIYPVMARELAAEKRIGTQIEDPREFLYVEAKLTLEHAAASVRVGSDADGWTDSARGKPELAVSRNGWVRIAVHAPSKAKSMTWECRAVPSAPAGAIPRCQIEWTRVFRLGPDYLPGENLSSPGSTQLGAGLGEPTALNDR